MALTENIYWDLMLELAEGQDEEFDALMTEMVAATEQERGCVAYEWHRSGNAVHIYERYADNAAAGIHMQNFQASFAKRFFTLLKPSEFFVYGPVSGPLRDGLEKAGAKLFNQIGGFCR